MPTMTSVHVSIINDSCDIQFEVEDFIYSCVEHVGVECRGVGCFIRVIRA